MAIEHTEADRLMVQAHFRRRAEERRQKLAARLEQARCDFDAIVEMLVQKYHPTRVYQWGSLINTKHFSEISDIDIAVEGILDPETYFRMLGDAEGLTELPLDLVQLEFIHPVYADGIRRNGRLVYERRRD